MQSNYVGRRNKQFSYVMGDCNLTEVKREKDLGVVLRADMKSSDQCKQVCNKAS